MAQVQATVGIQNSAFKRGLDTMRDQAAQFGSDIKNTIAGAFAFGAVSNFFTTFVKDMARVQDIADRFGQTATTIQKVGNVAELSGTNLETVAKALTSLTIEAAGANEKFAALGINASDFANAGYEQQILMLASAYEVASQDQAKMITLMELLGGKGQDILPMLSGGAAALAEQLANVTTVSDSTVAAMSRLDDAVTSVGQKIKGHISDVLEWATLAANVIANVARGGPNAVDRAIEQLGTRTQNESPSTAAPSAATAADPAAAAAKAKTAADEQKKTLDAQKALEQEIQDLARSRMSDEEKITDLKREQAAAAAAAADKSNPEVKRLEEAKKVLEIQKEIEDTQKNIDKTKADEAAKVAKKKADEDEKTQKAETALADEQKKQQLEKMTPAQRIATLKQDQTKLYDEAKELEKKGDKSGAATTRLKGLQLNDDIDAAKKELDDKKDPTKTKAPGVVSSSLGAIGGGGGVFVASFDPALQEARRQTNLLQQLVTNTSRASSNVQPTNPF